MLRVDEGNWHQMVPISSLHFERTLFTSYNNTSKETSLLMVEELRAPHSVELTQASGKQGEVLSN
jgi:hypothetical protein